MDFILVSVSWNFIKGVGQIQIQDFRISIFEEYVQFSFMKNTKRLYMATSELYMLKLLLQTSKGISRLKDTIEKCRNNLATR